MQPKVGRDQASSSVRRTPRAPVEVIRGVSSPSASGKNGRMRSSLVVAALMGVLAVGCSKCGKKEVPLVAADDGGAAAEQPPSPNGATLRVGALRYGVPPTPASKPFGGQAFGDLRVKLVASAVDGGAADAPGWPYFEQLFVAKATGALLAQQGVAVDGSRAYDEFFQLYEQNRYRPLLISSEEVNTNDDYVIKRRFLASVPSVVTADVVLHNLHLFFDYALAQAEVTRFLPEQLRLVEALLAETLAQRVALAKTPWAKAVDDNLVFLAVARVFLASAEVSSEAPAGEGTVGIDTLAEAEAFTAATRAAIPTLLPKALPAELAGRVTAEVNRVLDAKVTAKPDVFEYPGEFKEDYSQYTPRGHYLKLVKLQAYFRATMWLSRVMMSMATEHGPRSAALLSLAATRGDALERWRALSEAVAFLVGPPDDASFSEVLPLLASAKGGVLDDEATFAAVRAALERLPAPRVQSVVTKTAQGPSLDDQRAFHFFPQRAVIDAVLFQSLVEPQVAGKTFVRALEVPAVLGSSLAASLLEPEGLTQFEGYAAQRAKLKAELPAALGARKSSELVAGWMYSMQPLLEPVPAGVPAFMQSSAFEALRLNTYLASYAQLKHDTVLYAKQAAAEMGGPGFEDSEETIDDRGYVVPEVALYARVGVVLRNLEAGLRERKLFPEALGESFTRFVALAAKLEAISRKELAGEALSTEDYHLIKFIGGDLEHFWEETLITGKGGDRFLLLDENNTRLIADVFTGPGGVQHVASGWVHPVYVVFPRDGKQAVGRGGVLSFYEVNASERLSDPKWRSMLNESRPALPAWTKPVIAVDPQRLERFDSMSGE